WLIAAAPHALHVSKLPVIAFPVLMLVVHGVRMLSLEREVLHVSIHAVHAGPARTRDAAVAAPAAAAAASHGVAPRVDRAEKRGGGRCENKNDFCAHRDRPIGGITISCATVVQIDRQRQITKPRLVNLTLCARCRSGP